MERFKLNTAPCRENQYLIVNNLRVSIITNNIIRVEKSRDNKFVDLASQTVVNRDICEVEWQYYIDKNKIKIVTKKHTFVICTNTLNVYVDGIKAKKGGKDNLKGTVRTLDGKAGPVRLGNGIFSKNGVTLFDDSKTLLLNEDGTIKQREKGCKDLYVFAFGKDYYSGLNEFFSLTGFPPIMPKYVFGNWWSRYHEYSDIEYLQLMDKFKNNHVPFTVATIDMDWHLVKDVPKDAAISHNIQGRGWTGYTFNTKLFPNYKEFFKKLKKDNLHITMNLHPKDGVRYFETQYIDMAQANGIDPKSKKPVEFDLTNQKFLSSYFDILHHPYEEDGVDFWWIDWQQGTKSKMKGLDPLWLLNHYHTLDINRNSNCGLILSRYAGVGSHRYPLGFSGDTFVTWQALNFQPYFTANASNVGYTWWSHDIGGHMCNKGDEEIYLRWIQLGTFSPINRLHSTKNNISKEPWNYPKVRDKAIKYLQLRHQLIPYLYTACIKTNKEGFPLVQPLYYKYDTPIAYKKKYRNQYLFGSEMLVCPVTKKGDENGTVLKEIWLPKGNWIDFTTNKYYEGDKELKISCPLEYIPVFVKEGGIVPMIHDYKTNDVSYKELDILISIGNNKFELFDDKGSLIIEQKLDKDAEISITPKNDIDIQKMNIKIIGIKSCTILYNEKAFNTNEISIEQLPAKLIIQNIER